MRTACAVHVYSQVRSSTASRFSFFQSFRTIALPFFVTNTFGCVGLSKAHAALISVRENYVEHLFVSFQFTNRAYQP